MQTVEFQILAVLAQEMNMRKAAERLFVSQPALSQRLQSIEKSWGVKIFLRSQKGLALTPAGEKITTFAQEVVEKGERVREEIEALDSEVYGTLKLAVASIAGQYWLPAVLKQFVKKYPLVKVSLITGWSSEMLRHIYEDHVHIGILRGNPEWKGRKLHLFSDSLYLVDTEMEKLEDLHDTSRPFIQFKSDSNYHQEIQEWWHRQFKTVPQRTIIVDQIETCKQMVLNGIGYAILPAVTIEGEDSLTKIPLMDAAGTPMMRDTWLIGYESGFQLKQVQAFIEVVRDTAGIE